MDKKAKIAKGIITPVPKKTIISQEKDKGSNRSRDYSYATTVEIPEENKKDCKPEENEETRPTMANLELTNSIIAGGKPKDEKKTEDEHQELLWDDYEDLNRFKFIGDSGTKSQDKGEESVAKSSHQAVFNELNEKLQLPADRSTTTSPATDTPKQRVLDHPNQASTRPRITARRKTPRTTEINENSETTINKKSEESHANPETFRSIFQRWATGNMFAQDGGKGSVVNKPTNRLSVKKFTATTTPATTTAAATAVTNTTTTTSKTATTTSTTKTTSANSTNSENVKMAAPAGDSTKFREILLKVEGYKTRVERFQSTSNQKQFKNLETSLLMCRLELDELEVSEHDYKYRKMAYKAVHDTLSELYCKNYQC